MTERLPESLPPQAVAPTLFGYTLYRICLLAMYAMFVALGTWAWLRFPERGGGPVGGLLIGLGVVFGAGVLASFRFPVKPWAWSLHAAVICIGVPLVVTTPFAVLIGMAWLKPEIKAFYGITPEPDEESEPAPPSPSGEASS